MIHLNFTVEADRSSIDEHFAILKCNGYEIARSEPMGWADDGGAEEWALDRLKQVFGE